MSAAHITPGVYFIQNIGTNTVLDLTNGSSANSTKVQGYAKRELSDPWAPAQLWIIAPVSGNDPLYTIQNTNSRTYADLTGSNVASGTPIIGYQGTGNPNQHWVFSLNADKSAYVIRNQSTGTFIDLLNGGSANGTAVNGWAGEGATTGNTHQLWRLVHV
ncbi:ricin B-like lectin [Irpex rosettiformis]|uniref:Ricin B-like lectin n=1 Tax=Irpex rosettiformis TaxID=378272 RepID=A0ACB8U8H6_9APHY|nr:ricin B-like lectin [Irpex rosettiformis]